MSKKKRYDAVISILMADDRNANWDEIYEDYDKDLDKAVLITILCLERMVKDEDYDKEYREFFLDQLEELKNI